jgi:hypothetical protein
MMMVQTGGFQAYLLRLQHEEWLSHRGEFPLHLRSAHAIRIPQLPKEILVSDYLGTQHLGTTNVNKLIQSVTYFVGEGTDRASICKCRLLAYKAERRVALNGSARSATRGLELRKEWQQRRRRRCFIRYKEVAPADKHSALWTNKENQFRTHE